jgi:hypothetical protein
VVEGEPVAVRIREDGAVADTGVPRVAEELDTRGFELRLRLGDGTTP